jgi:Tol biopolymer transport system component
MKNIREMKSLLRGLLLMSILVFPWLVVSCQSNPPPTVALESQTGLGARSTIRLHFSSGMDNDTAEAHFSIQPAIPGHFAWKGKTMEFHPSQPFSPGNHYDISLTKGSTAVNGAVIDKDFHWSIEIRPASLVYLSTVTTGSELWRIAADGSNTLQLTFTGGNVADFAPSWDGETIAFSLKNSLGGEDLWLVDRDGKQTRELVNCDQDVCAEPSWSPDSSKIAFSRRSTSTQPEIATTEQIWILDVSSGDVTQLFSDAAMSGNQPSWSPDGSRIAYFDTPSNQVGIVDLSSGQTWYLPATTGIIGNWSGDGSKLFFTTEENTGNNLVVDIYEADVFKQQYTLSSLNEIHGGREYNVPAWSPDGQAVIFGERCMYCSPTTQLWLAEKGGRQLTRITTDERFTNSAYQWDITGEKAVFQRYQLGSSTAIPEIVVWDRSSGELHVIAQGAVQPAWLP